MPRPIPVGEEVLKEADEMLPREQLSDAAHGRSAIGRGSVRLVNFVGEAVAFFRLPCDRLLAGDKSRACATGQFPPFEEPSCAKGISAQAGGIAAHAVVYPLNHQRIGKAHGPLDAVDGERESRAVRAAGRDDGDAVHVSGDVGKIRRGRCGIGRILQRQARNGWPNIEVVEV